MILIVVSVESTGALTAAEIFVEACGILEGKCTGLIMALEEMGLFHNSL